MRKKIGRNEPCPCGSGKKYKRCCLGRDNEVGRRCQEMRTAMEVAVEWLLDCYEEEANEEILKGFFEAPEYLEAIDEISPLEQHAVDTNALEWLVAEAWLDVGEDRRSALSLVLGGAGPPLRPEQRAWLEEMERHAVSLYEVRGIGPGAALELQDLIEPARPRLKLVDPVIANEVEVGSTFGARLLPMDDHWLRTPALYPLDSERVDSVEYAVGEVRQELAEFNEVEEARYPWEFGNLVIGNWLIQVFEGFVDLDGFGVLSPHVTRYRVDDWDRLAAALAEEDDVEGDRTTGWTLFEFDDEIDDDDRFWVFALNPTTEDRLEAVTIFERFVDDGREWLEGVAGGAVTFLESETLQSDEARLAEIYYGRPEGADAAEFQARLEKGYDDWMNRPIPFLRGKPPALAIRTEEGRARVIELLEGYEDFEEGVAADEEREPASYRFLWEAVGLGDAQVTRR